MEEIQSLINELKSLMPKDDAQSAARRDEICTWFKENKSPEAEKAFKAFLEEGFNEIGSSIADLRRQISDEDYRIIPISYIAEKYFHKSHAWLSQRLNGTKVRGKSYSLNAEQKNIFNNAMQDIAMKFGSFRLV